MTIEQAKQTELIVYLSKLGYQPAKISRNNFWYLSPFRTEKTPSFKVNAKINQWFDFGEGKGGNIIDFGILFWKCSVSDFLQKINDLAIPIVQPKIDLIPEKNLTVVSVSSIQSFALLEYLKTRNISYAVASQFLKEVNYEINGKKYFALGIKNDAGGYELRNAFFKGSSSPKASTFIDNGASNIAVFEGVFNFLSYQQLLQKQPTENTNFLILNSVAFFEKSRTLLETHSKVQLYLDNDLTGDKYTLLAQTILKEKCTDQRTLYQHYKDLNEWLTGFGKQHISIKHRQ